MQVVDDVWRGHNVHGYGFCVEGKIKVGEGESEGIKEGGVWTAIREIGGFGI
jgi:hypothetical protein